MAHPGDAARDARGRARRARRRALILALETSCDDTCAAVVTRAGEIRANVISSQGVHDRYGGVVPEIASRHHLELVNAVVDDALARAGASARRRRARRGHAGPGARRARCSSASRPRRGWPRRGGCRSRRSTTCRATWPRPTSSPSRWSRRSCACSPRAATRCWRGSTEPGAYEVLGRTLDDAAGEAFDKGARLLGLPLPGRPGAVAARRARATATRSRSRPPRGSPGLDFSFAGLKTALLYAVRDLGEEETRRRAADLAASYEHAIVEALVLRVERALAAEPGARLALGGGVAANALLRERAAGLGVELKVPPPELCTDNAAMIALGRALGRAAALPGLPRARRVRQRAARHEGPAAPGTGLALGRCCSLLVVVAVLGERGGSGGGGGARVPPSAAALLGLRRALAAASPAGGEQRVLVELPRPALADRDDLESLSAEEQRAYVRSLGARGGGAALGARRARGRAARRGRVRAHVGRLRRDRRRLRPRVAVEPRRARAAGAPLLSRDERAGAGARRRAAACRRAPRRLAGADRDPRHGRRRAGRLRAARAGLRRARARRRPDAGRRPAHAVAARDDAARRWPEIVAAAGERVLTIRVAGLRLGAPGGPRHDGRAARRARARGRPGRRRRGRRRRAGRAGRASTRRTRASPTRPRRRRCAGAARARHARRRARRQRGPGARRRTASSARRAARGRRSRRARRRPARGAAAGRRSTIGERELRGAAVLGGAPPRRRASWPGRSTGTDARGAAARARRAGRAASRSSAPGRTRSPRRRRRPARAPARSCSPSPATARCRCCPPAASPRR